MSTATEAPNNARARWPRIVALVACGALLLVVGRALWWWSHPTLLAGTAQVDNVEGYPAPVSRAGLYVGVAGPGGDHQHGAEDITFRSVSAHFSSNGAAARAAFVICVPNEDNTSVAVVPNDRPLSAYCASTRPIERGTVLQLRDAPRAAYVVLVVTPTRPGDSKVDRITFDYARQWKHGGQRGGENVEGLSLVLHATG